MAIEPKIGGYKTTLNINDLANPDESITITPEGDISQTVKNFPIRYYSASTFGRSNGAAASALSIDSDTTSVQTVVTDLVGEGSPAPTITFEANSLNDNIPEVTLYWMTTTSPQRTVFATCSGVSTNSLNNSPTTWDMLWAPNSYINGLDFHPKKNYTEMAIGGYFNELGGTRNTGSLKNSYRMYGIINLTGGNNIFQQVEGNNTNFGPLGLVLSGSKANIGYAGGIDGLKLLSTNNSTNYIRTVKYISISATQAPGVQNAISKSRNYLCIGGKFSTISWNGSSLLTNGLFIVDIDRPQTHFCRFDFNTNVDISCLEYDPDYQSLIIGSTNTLGTARMLSGLSSANFARSYMGLIERSSELDKGGLGPESRFVEVSSGGLGTVARLYLGYRDSLPINTGNETPLWSRFHFDSKFGQQATSQYTSYPLNAIYLKDVVYLAGHIITSVAPEQRGVCALYCGEGRYGRDDSSYIPDNKRHESIGKLISFLPQEYFNDIRLRWPSAITFIEDNRTKYTNIFDIKLRRQYNKYYMYIAGSFKYFTDQNGSFVYQPDNKTLSRIVTVFDITDSITSAVRPTVVNNWKPLPNNYVTSITTGFDGEGDENVVYLLGHFKNITITNGGVFNRNGCCAITKPDPNINASVLNWTTNIGILSATNEVFKSKKLYNIPNTSPLSGLIINCPFAKTVNNYTVNDIFRVTRYAQDIAPYKQKTIHWTIGPKVLEGSDLAVPNTSFFTLSNVAGPQYVVNTTVFDTQAMKISTDGGMDSVTTGSLMRFLIQRTPRNLVPSTSADYYNGRAWILGASIDQTHPLT